MRAGIFHRYTFHSCLLARPWVLFVLFVLVFVFLWCFCCLVLIFGLTSDERSMGSKKNLSPFPFT